MLLLADGPLGQQLADRLGQDSCSARSDPYDALSEMGRRRWPAVVLTPSRVDFPGLCRAARRLQRDSRLFAVCCPSQELEVRPLLGEVLDDYFIFPLSNQDLTTLRGAAGLGEPPLPSAGGMGVGAGGAGMARQLAGLIESAHDVAGLEGYLVRAVAAQVGSPVAWVNAEQVRAGVAPLLLAAGPSPRVLVPRGPAHQATPAARAYLAAVQECLPALLATARRTEMLHRLSITDHLTGALNRRHFYERTDQILLQADRRGFRVTLLLWDIDDFKRYNDTYGHAVGDEILCDIAALMKRITRSQDVVARIGGDEFAVLFWDEDRPRAANSRPPETAYALADRFRQAVQDHAFASLGPEARGSLTISGGLASFPADGRNVRDLLRRADAGLREAKRSGKNAIHLVGKD
jgi:diguanylate cyclase (GGDEF)-like protein